MALLTCGLAAQDAGRFYEKWLKEDVAYIIVPEERAVYLKLTTAAERDRFIEDFWKRRDPTPGTSQNECREEHYRRLAYANDRLGAGRSGWRTDRGRAYIVFGPPNRVESYPTGNYVPRGTPEGGSVQTYPYEVWEYRYVEGLGTDIVLEFVDKQSTGDYQLALDPRDKDTLYTVMKVRGDWEDDPRTWPIRQQPLEIVELYAKLHTPPPVRLAELRDVVEARVTYSQLPFNVRDHYLRATAQTGMAVLTFEVQNRDLSYRIENGRQATQIHFFGRVSNVKRELVQIFEESLPVQFDPKERERVLRGRTVHQKVLTLPGGRYSLDLVAKDEASGHLGTQRLLLLVPPGDAGKLSCSSIFLCDFIAAALRPEQARGPFLLGNVTVMPNVRREFPTSYHLGVYFQIYHLQRDASTLQAAPVLEAGLWKDGKLVRELPQSMFALRFTSETTLDVDGRLPLTEFAPGDYEMRLSIEDKLSSQKTTATAAFKIL